MNDDFGGRLLDGRVEDLRRARALWAAQPVDRDLAGEPNTAYPARRRTVARPATVRGPGTFFGKAMRSIIVEPFDGEGWWIDRTDLPDSLPTRVSVRNVWTTGRIVSNIVLRSGAPNNYIRMVEHIAALRLGLGINDLMIRIDSGDPPLFVRGSLDLVEAIESAGFRETDRPVPYVTVREPVAVCSPAGAFLVLEPCPGPEPELLIDAAVDFDNAIGKQRIRFRLDRDRFVEGAVARTNTTHTRKLYCQTVGRVFADVRHLGYTHENLLVAGRRRYVNEPRLVHGGKSLEAVWHRAALDLLAALALVEEGRFVGRVTSYKAGHALDVKLVTQLYLHGLVVPFAAGPGPVPGGG